MDTCGVDAAVPRAPRAGHFVEVSQSGSAVSWGPAANTAAGGQYRLCWWSGTREVGNATTVVSEADTPNTDFVVDVGKLDVIGPWPLEQDRTCVSGQTCVLTSMSGHELAIEDRWLILDTCGVPPLPHGIGPDLDVSSGMNWIWRSTLSASGGEYRLCWCHGSLPESLNLTNTSNANASLTNLSQSLLLGRKGDERGGGLYQQDKT